MALVKCPECGKEVSSLANACIGCGFPIKEYVEQDTFKKEVDRLTKKIKPIAYTYPEPRVRVCIKCGAPFIYNKGVSSIFGFGGKVDIPICQCGIGDKKYPGYDVDYPATSIVNRADSMLYIKQYCVIPMNIGDQDSEESAKYEALLKEEIKDYEEGWGKKATPRFPEEKESGAGFAIPHYMIGKQPIPPKPQKPKCPHCQSENLSKISGTKKFAKIATFGLFGADDLGKTYKCNNCGSKF